MSSLIFLEKCKKKYLILDDICKCHDWQFKGVGTQFYRKNIIILSYADAVVCSGTTLFAKHKVIF